MGKSARLANGAGAGTVIVFFSSIMPSTLISTPYRPQTTNLLNVPPYPLPSSSPLPSASSQPLPRIPIPVDLKRIERSV